MVTFTKPAGTLPAAVLAASFSLGVGAVTVSAAPNSDVYRASATGPDAAPISQQLEAVQAPEPGRATASTLKTVILRAVKRTDIVEAPRPGRGRM